MGERINIQNLIDLFAEKKGLSKKDAETFLKEMFALIEQVLETDKYVKIKGFGTFKLIDVDSRESVNVNTGERIEIKGHTKISFTPETSIRDQINKPFSHFETVILNEGAVFDDMNPGEEDDIDGDSESETSSGMEEALSFNDEVTENAADQPTTESVEIPNENTEIKDEEIITPKTDEVAAVDELQIISKPEDVIAQDTEVNEENTALSKADEVTEVDEPQSIPESKKVIAQDTEVKEEVVVVTPKAGEVVIANKTDAVEDVQIAAKPIEIESQNPEAKAEETTPSKVQENEAVKENMLINSEESLAVIPKEKPEDEPEKEDIIKQKNALIEELIAAAKAQKDINSVSVNKSTIYYFVGMVTFLAIFAIAIFTYIYNPDFIMNMLPASTEVSSADSVMVDSVPAKMDAIAMADTIPSVPQQEIEKAVTADETNKTKIEADKAEKPIIKEQTAEKTKSDESDSKDKKPEKLNPNNYTITGTKSVYTVQKGESLVRISQHYYNSKDLWTLIVKHNPTVITNPDYVPAGTVIKIPNLRSKL